MLATCAFLQLNNVYTQCTEMLHARLSVLIRVQCDAYIITADFFHSRRTCASVMVAQMLKFWAEQ